MILLLQGSTDVGRIALAERVVKEHVGWRHLPVEGLAEIEFFSHLKTEPTDEILLSLACHLAREMHNQKLSTILSFQDATAFLKDIQEELGGHLVTIHLAADNKPFSSCDHVLDVRSKSVNELYKEIAGIIGAS